MFVADIEWVMSVDFPLEGLPKWDRDEARAGANEADKIESSDKNTPSYVMGRPSMRKFVWQLLNYDPRTDRVMHALMTRYVQSHGKNERTRNGASQV